MGGDSPGIPSHIRHFERRQYLTLGLTPVRSGATRSRYRTRRALIPPRAVASARCECTIASSRKSYGDEGGMCDAGTGYAGASGNGTREG